MALLVPDSPSAEMPPLPPSLPLEAPAPLPNIQPAPPIPPAKRLSERLRVGMRVRDHTGLVHRIIRFVKHGDTGEVMVVHRAACNCDYDGFTWVRPRAHFDELIEVDGLMLPRFTEVAVPPVARKPRSRSRT